jgi:tRNA(fMet)-specific endonuclease VapC
VLIDAERRGRGFEAIGFGVDGPVLSSIVIAEFLAGAILADNEQRRRARERFLTDLLVAFPVLSFGVEEARVHARLYVELRRAGTPIGERDLLIAATALANGHSVMTRNVREFNQVPGLTVVALPGSEG